MSRQNQHQAELRAIGADDACKFLLESQSFARWYSRPDCGQLVIFGDMGCGKSVASAFLVDRLRLESKHQLPQAKVCYYYCQGDESGQALHIFSTLILELLEQFVGLVKTFYNWHKENQASGQLGSAANAAMLANFLKRTLESIDRPIFIVIDGLDECDRLSRDQLLGLLDSVVEKNTVIKTVLLSRPSEEITKRLSQATRIDFIPNPERDATIARHTVENQLSHLSEDAKLLITETVSRRAKGSAIWTKMMIELIQVRGHRALGPISDLLENSSAPEHLSSLYKTLLLRCTSWDSENYEIATTALRLLSVSCRPLSIMEVAWAVALATASSQVTTIKALSRLVDHERIFGFIHPFINRVDFSDLKKRQVGLVHQSVREFLQIHHTSKGHSRQCFASGETSGSSLSSPSTELLEASILEICLRYLALDEIGHDNLFSAHQMMVDEFPEDTDLFNEPSEPTEYNPYCSWEDWEGSMIRFDPAERGFGEFFVYASCHWLEHFGNIETTSLFSMASMENICEAGSTRLRNWIEQNRRPGCAIKPRFEFDSSLYDPLSIASLYGSKAVLIHLLRSADFAQRKYTPDSAVAAARQIQRWGESTRLQLLYESRIGDQLRAIGVSDP